MATSTVLIIIVGMGVVTYLTRLPLYFLTVRRYELPPLLGCILERIPAAAFAAIVFSGVLQPGGKSDFHWTNLYIYAAAITAIFAIFTRRGLLAVIVVGIFSAAALNQIFG